MSNHDVTIATGVVTTHEPRDPDALCSVTTMTSSRAVSVAVDATVHRMRLDAGDVAATLAELDGRKVTLLLHGTNMMGAPVVVARPATLFNGGEAYLPKGARKNGFRVDPSKVIGVVAGYDTDAAAALYARYDIGDVADVTREVLEALPHDPEARDCTLAVMTTTVVAGDRAPGSVWLLYSYDPENDICDGMLVVPDGSPLQSEYGSIYGRDLIDRGAVLTGATPVPFATAIEFTTVDEALAAIGR